MSFRVIVVDDDYRVASLHRVFVERVSGFEVVGEAHSGETALTAATQLHPDLILLDLYLPDIPGLEVLRRLAHITGRPIDVIVITAARDVASVEEAVRSGALYYLVKPFGPSVLCERLNAYAAMRHKLDAIHEASQAQVDEIYAALRTNSDRPLPKGHSPQTLGVIVETLRGAGEELSSEEVASRSGVSRATAQRYLSYLSSIGRINLILRYGPGRPEHRYRWPL
ncbi:MAG: response regulator [Ferrimicrobium sp.]